MATIGDPSREDIEGELARIDLILRELAAAEAEFEHMARRQWDALERAGGHDAASERELARLRTNVKKNERERQHLEKRRADLLAKLGKMSSGNNGSA